MKEVGRGEALVVLIKICWLRVRGMNPNSLLALVPEMR